MSRPRTATPLITFAGLLTRTTAFSILAFPLGGRGLGHPQTVLPRPSASEPAPS